MNINSMNITAKRIEHIGDNYNQDVVTDSELFEIRRLLDELKQVHAATSLPSTHRQFLQQTVIDIENAVSRTKSRSALRTVFTNIGPILQSLSLSVAGNLTTDALKLGWNQAIENFHKISLLLG